MSEIIVNPIEAKIGMSTRCYAALALKKASELVTARMEHASVLGFKLRVQAFCSLVDARNLVGVINYSNR